MARLSKEELDKLFPYDMFPVRMEWVDGKAKKIAYFMCHEHMQKQYDKIKKPRLKIDVRYKYPSLKPEEKPKKNARKKANSKTGTSSEIIR